MTTRHAEARAAPHDRVHPELIDVEPSTLAPGARRRRRPHGRPPHPCATPSHNTRSVHPRAPPRARVPAAARASSARAWWLQLRSPAPAAARPGTYSLAPLAHSRLPRRRRYSEAAPPLTRRRRPARPRTRPRCARRRELERRRRELERRGCARAPLALQQPVSSASTCRWAVKCRCQQSPLTNTPSRSRLLCARATGRGARAASNQL